MLSTIILSTIIEKLMRPQPPPLSADEAALLASCSLPNPDNLRRQLAAFEEQLGAAVARGDALDRQPRQAAFSEQQALAAHLPHLRAQIDALKSQIAAAEHAQSAFLELARLLAETDETIATLAAEFYARVLVSSEAERRERMLAIDAQVRLRGRLAAALQADSSARRFRRGGPDPFGNLRSDLLARVAEIDRFRAPGSVRPSVPWPAGALQLMDVLARKGGTA